MTPPRPLSAGVTDPGRKRSDNQDSLVVRNDVCLWAVADGMGGHLGGKWASEQIKAALDSLPLTEDFDENFRRIGGAVHSANATISARGLEAGSTMGSTVAILYSLGSRYAIFWAGDSRVYLLRGGELLRMTTDHTWVQEMIDGGLLTAADAETHPNRHVLSRAVGAAPKLTLDAVLGEIEPDDHFLLCSDGLTGVVPEPEITDHLNGNSASDATVKLLKLVLERNAPDNVTIITVVYQ